MPPGRPATNLGRAPLSKASIAAMNTVFSRYNNLEFDAGTGERGSRHTHTSLTLPLTGLKPRWW